MLSVLVCVVTAGMCCRCWYVLSVLVCVVGAGVCCRCLCVLSVLGRVVGACVCGRCWGALSVLVCVVGAGVCCRCLCVRSVLGCVVGAGVCVWSVLGCVVKSSVCWGVLLLLCCFVCVGVCGRCRQHTSEHHVHNSKQLARDLGSILIEEDEVIASHDVVSLFTNIPVPETIAVIRRKLEEDTGLKKRTNLDVDDIIELLDLILNTTYFTFQDVFYKQVTGSAMGSPVSSVVAEFCMEWLEGIAIATAPLDCRPSLWKRYVDDILEKLKSGQLDNLTSHLNTVDVTNNIKFTHEEEKDGMMPFLDTLIVRKPDGHVKILVYRKKTHTDQYLNFDSHHPLHQKLGVIRTLLDRCNNIVTDDLDRVSEVSHIEKALERCGYPKWSFDVVKRSMASKQISQSKRKDKNTQGKRQVLLPYIEKVTEKVSRILGKHGVNTVVKPHCTLRRLLVHPKDKVRTLKKANCVYRIPCKSCDKSYVGETGRSLGLRMEEHRKEAEKSESRPYTRSSKSLAASEIHKSAIMDHVVTENHVMDWDNIRVLDREEDRTRRWIKEAIWIRKSVPVLNRDEGGLPTVAYLRFFDHHTDIW